MWDAHAHMCMHAHTHIHTEWSTIQPKKIEGNPAICDITDE